jgi:hypothetical protein
VYSFLADFPRGLVVLICVFGALGVAWLALLRRGTVRILGLAVAALLIGVAIGALVSGDHLLQLVLVAVGFAFGLAGADLAFSVSHALPPAPAPSRPVLFVNPRSGGGKAKAFNLIDEAASRGIEAVELKPGDDLESLARDAVARGANGLAMAGGDGSQALIAAIAAEHDLPYACIPSGTRNHFALDLGVDRDDVVGALDAFVDGGEKPVDLAEVNGRVFVNNVSLGVYAEAVSQEGYRGAKLRTLIETLPATLGPDGTALELRWVDPEGNLQRSSGVVLVSNDAYRLGAAIGSGTRPRLNEGVLGIVDFRPPVGGARESSTPWRQLTMSEFEIDADEPVATGIDGEAVTLKPPLRFHSRPGALRVRISRRHPGASPAAEAPVSPLAALKKLGRIAIQRPG